MTKRLPLPALIGLLASSLLAPLPAGAADPGRDDKGWVSLFNGKDLTGWKTHPDKPGQWQVEAGAIVSRGNGVSHLFSDRGDFTNFHLRAQAQINAKGDSGVIFRSEYGLNRLHRGKTGSYPNGYEAQIQLAGVAKSPLVGSLIDFVSIHEPLVQPETWFTLEVIAEGTHLVIKIDGKTTTDVRDEKNTYGGGHFALQQHDAGTVAKFRKIEVKNLDPAKAVAAKAAAAKHPAVFDLLKYQTPIRNQGGRDSCPYFPPVAALEAAYARQGVKVDLSVEHLIWLRNVAFGSSEAPRNVAEDISCMTGGGNGVWVLKQLAICRAQDMPYHELDIDRTPTGKSFGMDRYDWGKPFSQFVLNRWNFDPHILPPQARANARYAIETLASFAPSDLRNPRKFEEVLASGHEIIISINIHPNSDDTAIGQPVWRLKPNTPGDVINHFMLVVGYDRARKFFIVKNQWGATNYTAMKKKLAPGWQDIVKYNGYTLMDYNYLGTCAEAHYITEVAPIGSPRFAAQRALGQWQVAFKHDNKTLLSGVLCWRHLPDPSASPKPNLRVGDLSTADGQQFRVNGKWGGDGTKPDRVTLFIDWEKGVLPLESTGGAAWSGTVVLPESGKGTMSLKPAGGARQKIKGVDAAEVELSAELVGDKNLLKSLAAPR